MTLFTDGTPASIDDLRRYDSAVDTLAHAAVINLDAKLAVAAEEVGQSVASFLVSQISNRGLTGVVVTPSLRRWHALRTLAGLYRDAYGSDVTDRYRLKWEEYEKLARQAEDYAFATGIGLSRSPVAKAPLAVVIAATEVSGRTDCTIRVTWVNGEGVEGAPSDPVESALGCGDQITISGTAPDAVTGWNVYIGAGDDTLRAQNDTPIGVEVPWSVQYISTEGKPVIEGQSPDYLVVERRILLRG